MNKTLAWMSIIVISLIAAYNLVNRQPPRPQAFINFIEPGAYSISYPPDWFREEQGLTSGSEILTLYSYDYRNLNINNGGFGPGQIKITVSILAKGLKSLEQIAENHYSETTKNCPKERFIVNGLQAIRMSIQSGTGANLSPRIEMYVDYSGKEYALITGYYNGDKTAAAIIRKIQESFKNGSDI